MPSQEPRKNKSFQREASRLTKRYACRWPEPISPTNPSDEYIKGQCGHTARSCGRQNLYQVHGPDARPKLDVEAPHVSRPVKLDLRTLQLPRSFVYARSLLVINRRIEKIIGEGPVPMGTNILEIGKSKPTPPVLWTFRNITDDSQWLLAGVSNGMAYLQHAIAPEVLNQ